MESLRDSGKIVGSPASLRDIADGCGLTSPLSLQSFLKKRGCPYSRCIQLHIKILHSPTNFTVDEMIEAMRRVYATADIRVVAASGQNLSSSVSSLLLDVDVGSCSGTTTSEQEDLFDLDDFVGNDDNEIVIYFVRSTVPGSNGCATHPSGHPGAVIAESASLWTLAHEVGHVLDLNHISGEDDASGSCVTPDYTRLMTGCSTDNITGTPMLDDNEVETMRSNSFTLSC